MKTKKQTTLHPLQKLRLSLGISRLKLAIELGVDPTSIMRWEREGFPKAREIAVREVLRKLKNK